MFRRIVSLAPSNTEILFAIGLGDRIVGVTEYCNYPGEAEQKEKVGGFSTVDIEKVLSLAPDLVLATDFHAETIVPRLREKGANVGVVEGTGLLDAPHCIQRIGDITEARDEAHQLAREIRRQFDAIIEKTKPIQLPQRPRVCYLCMDHPLKIARSTCPPNRIIRALRGANVGGDMPGDAPVDLETVIRKDPQVFITSRGHGETSDLLAYVQNETLLRDTQACRNQRVYRIDSDLVCRPGPRAPLGLETMARFIHPDVFGEPEKAGIG